MSLRTRRFREAEHRAALLTEAFGAAWTRATVEAEATGKDLQAIIRDYLRDVLDGDIPGRLPLTFLALPTLRHGLGKAKEARAKCNVGEVQEDVSRLMDTHGLPVGMRYRLGIEILGARVAAYQEAIARATGEAPTITAHYRMTETAPPATGAADCTDAVTPLAAPSAPLASSLVDAFIQHRQEWGKVTLRQQDEERASVARFIEVAGDKPPAAYQRRDLTTFFNTMRKLPQSYGKAARDKGRTLADIIADPSRANMQRIGTRTLDKHLNVLRGFTRFAVNDGHMTVTERADLVDEHDFGRDAVLPPKARRPFTPEELARLFKSPVWTGRHRTITTKPGPHIIRDAFFWLPILALYHGARMEELADLKRKDVAQHHGLWALHIHADDRRVKNRAAIRKVPLHPEVMKLGFVQHVMAETRDDADPIFPDLTPRGVDKRRGVDAIKWFGRYRKAVGAGWKETPFHAFRHTAITRLTDALDTDRQRRHRDRIMGHTSPGGSEGDNTYDDGPQGFPEVAATLSLLSYPELDLSHLHVEPEGQQQQDPGGTTHPGG